MCRIVTPGSNEDICWLDQHQLKIVLQKRSANDIRATLNKSYIFVVDLLDNHSDIHIFARIVMRYNVNMNINHQLY